jgi:hypothetical protein
MPDRPFPAAAIAALSNGNKIEAIKIVRQEWEVSTNSQRGCITWLLVLALVGCALYYFLRVR